MGRKKKEVECKTSHLNLVVAGGIVGMFAMTILGARLVKTAYHMGFDEAAQLCGLQLQDLKP